jgi:hypothetical protein
MADETPAGRLLNKLVEHCDDFPSPQRTALERIETKLRYVAITVPEDGLSDDAQGGLGFILGDLADDISAVAWDLAQEEAKRTDALRAECYAHAAETTGARMSKPLSTIQLVDDLSDLVADARALEMSISGSASLEPDEQRALIHQASKHHDAVKAMHDAIYAMLDAKREGEQ